MPNSDDASSPPSNSADRPRPPGAIDARFTLASERTVLSWFRTALGLVAAGLAVMHALPDFSSQISRQTLGVGLMVTGIIAAVSGGLRWRQTNIALREGGEMPGPLPVWLLIGLLVVFSVFAIVIGV